MDIMDISPIVNLGRKVHFKVKWGTFSVRGTICMGVIHSYGLSKHSVVGIKKWSFLVLERKSRDGKCHYYVPGEYGDSELLKEIGGALSSKDWIDVFKISEKFDQAIESIKPTHFSTNDKTE